MSHKKRYSKSELLLERALQTIPLGSQTFSKSLTQFPLGSSPLFIEKGQGAKVWDVDGHEYIDFSNGLMAIFLGYQDPDVNSAVMQQLKMGVNFSLAHPIEMEVAEKLVEMIPCAEMVRFGKNGSDATAGAVRLARAYTGKEHLAVCGYHGWQDWYIGSTERHLGVPKSTQQLTHSFIYNDLVSLEKIFNDFPNQIAAVILEPMHVYFPQNDFLQQVKKITHAHQALLIFDEVITGCRLAIGGAQKYFNVIPDLATFGKGIGNGFPISAIVGRREIMQLMEEIFFSFTSGGETISLAATLATLNKMQTHPVIETLAGRGKQLIEGVNELLNLHELTSTIQIQGHPSFTLLTFQKTGQYNIWDIKTFIMQEMLARGILTIGSHNLSYAHTQDQIQSLLTTYNEVFALLQRALRQNNLHEQLNCQVLKPLFSVRN